MISNPPASATVLTPRHSSRRWHAAAAFSIIVVVAFLYRIPALLNARALDSDLAIVGLVARHILAGECVWFNWGSAYEGSFDATLTAAAFRIFGSSAIVLTLVSVVEFLVATWLEFDLIRRRTDTLRAAMCVMFLAVGGYAINATALHLPRQGCITLVIASIWLLDGAASSRRPAVRFGAGLLCYCIALWADLFAEVYLPGVAIFALMCLADPIARHSWQRQALAGAASALVGIVFVWLVHQTLPNATTKTGLSLEYATQNFPLLWNECLPFALGCKTLADADDVARHRVVTSPLPIYVFRLIAGWSLPAMMLAGAFIAARARNWVMLRLSAFALVTVGVVIAGFLVSVMPKDVWSVRYLGPIFWVAPLALTPLAARIGWRWFAVAIAPCLIVVGRTGWRTYDQAVDGLIPRMTARGKCDEEMQLAQFLRSRKITSASANYWLAYRLTFLFDENPVVVPLDEDHDRYKPYRDAYESAPIDAAIFHTAEPRNTPEEFEKRMRELNVRYERHDIGGFTVLIVPRR